MFITQCGTWSDSSPSEDSSGDNPVSLATALALRRLAAPSGQLRRCLRANAPASCHAALAAVRSGCSSGYELAHSSLPVPAGRMQPSRVPSHRQTMHFISQASAESELNSKLTQPCLMTCHCSRASHTAA